MSEENGLKDDLYSTGNFDWEKWNHYDKEWFCQL